MDNGHDWSWTEFVTSLGADFPALPDETVLSISASFFLPREEHGITDPVEGLVARKQAFRASTVSLAVEGGNKLRVMRQDLNQENPEIAQHLQVAVLSSAEIGEIAAPLLDFPKADWVWLDLCIGRVVSDNTPAEKLWSQRLKPWSHWLR